MSLLYAGILVPVIFGIQRCAGHRLSPTAKHALWLILLIRLSIPQLPESPLSIFNLTQPTEAPERQSSTQLHPPSNPLVSSPPTMHDRSQSPERLVSNESLPTGELVHVPLAPSSTPKTPPTQLHPIPSSKSHQEATKQLEQSPLTIDEPNNSAPKPVAWEKILLAIWAIGVFLFSVQVAAAWGIFKYRFRIRKQIFDAKIETLLDDCHQAVGVRGRIPVMESDLVTSPAVYGLFRPRILLPRHFIQTYSMDQLAHVITHELAHHKRKDALWNMWATLVQIFHWPNPLVWFAHSRMRADRELATDFLALKALKHDQSEAYGETILKSLQAASSQTTIPSLIGISEDRRHLLRRFQLISSFQAHRKYSLAVLTSILLTMAATVLTDARPRPELQEELEVKQESDLTVGSLQQPQSKKSGPIIHSIRVTVRDIATKAPIPGAVVSYTQNGNRKALSEILTDNEGRAEISIYRPTLEQQTLSLCVQPHTQHAGQARTWAIPSSRWTELPSEYSFYLPLGQTIGGIVVDPDRVPVRGAKLNFHSHHRNPKEFTNSRYFNIPYDRGIQTDQDGRWSVGGAPGDLRNLSIHIMEASGAQHRFTTTREFRPPFLTFGGEPLLAEELKSGQAIIELAPGRDVNVTVTDERGNPLPGVKVTEVHGAIEKRIGHSINTDARGSARFTGRPDREISYIAQHPDYAISSEVAHLTQDTQSLKITLPKLRPLRAQVIDKKGVPIQSATINLATPPNEDFFTDWETTTDANGYFEWREAPHSLFFVNIEAPQFEAAVLSSDQLRSTDTLTLFKSQESQLQLRVTVHDADNGNPIGHFQYALIRELANGFEIHGSSSDGQFEINERRARFTSSVLPRVGNAYHVAVRSPGYREAYSRRIAVNETNPTIALTLERTDSLFELTGRTILTPDGTPAKRAQVIMISHPGFLPYLRQQGNKRSLHTRPQHIEFRTDDDGTIPPVPLPERFHGVFIYHQSGTLSLSSKEVAQTKETLTLKADGRLEGLLSIGGESIANRKVWIKTDTQPQDLFSGYFKSETDSKGKFQIDSLPAGTYQLFLTPPSFSTGVMTPSYQKRVTIQPGQTNHVDYANPGPRIRGRLTTARPGRVVDWRHGRYQLTSVAPDQFSSKRPQHYHYVNWKRFVDENQEYISASQAKLKATQRSYYLNVGPGGFFNVEAVPPGDYQFDLKVTEPKQENVGHGWTHDKEIGQLTQSVSVPDNPNLFVFDAGTLRIPIADQERSPVPQLPRISSFNQQGEISSQRIKGKTAVLHFWAAWAEEGSDWWSELAKLRASDPDENALAILSFNVDGMRHEMTDFLKGTKHPWPVGFLPPDKATELLRHFKIKTLPATLVVDPTGAVSINDGNIETLEQMIVTSAELQP